MPSLAKDWFLAGRPWSFAMSAVSVGVGGALSALHGPFSWGAFAVTLLGVVAAHGATNLLNDYHDVRSGVDRPGVRTAAYRPHPLLEGRLTARQVLASAVLGYAVAGGAGAYLAALHGWVIAAAALLGLAASVGYTAPPLRYKHRALGELSVFLVWGPIIVGGTYYIQAGALSWDALWVSLPFGGLVAAVILANNLRDMEQDDAAGVRTLPVVAGRRGGLALYGALVVLAFAGIAWMSLFGPLGPWSLLVLLSGRRAFRLLARFRRAIPDDADARTARLDTAFGALLLLSLVLENLL